MKIFKIFLSLASIQGQIVPQIVQPVADDHSSYMINRIAGAYSRTENGLGRRYSQLAKMMKFSNPNFDQRKVMSHHN